MKKEIIFDLQLFDDPAAVSLESSKTADYVALSIASSKLTVKKATSAANYTLGTFEDTVYKEAETVSTGNTFNALAGNDKISVTSSVADISIIAGKGNDTIDIATEGRTSGKGNTYVYNYGDGKDVITGWNDDDTLKLVGASVGSTLMSKDGNDFIIKFAGTGQITFKGVTPGQKIKIDGITDPYTVPKLMQGTTAADVITNVQEGTGENAVAPKSGTDATTNKYVIDAGNGADKIYNEGSYISIASGAGNDTIVVKAKGTTAEVEEASRAVTSNVTIWSGAGADSINVTEDTIAGSNGAHVFEYRLGDGNDTIFGYNNNDSIVFKNADGTGEMTGVTFSADVNSSHNYVITIKQGTTIVGTLTLQKPDGGELYATKLNIYNGTNQLTGENTEGIYKIKPEPEDSSKDYWGIPYKITGTDSSDQALGANTENFIIDALAGNDVIGVSAASVSVNAGAGNDRITLTDGTNIETNEGKTAPNADKAVTILGGLGNDYIDVSNDYSVVGGTDTYQATHVFQFSATDGKDSIYGFNPDDSIILTDNNTNVVGNFDTTGKNFVISVGGTAAIWLMDYAGGQALNVFKNDGTTRVTIGGQAIEGNVNQHKIDAANAHNATAASGSEVEVPEGIEGWITPKILKGTTSSDPKANLTNVKDDFLIYADKGNDEIENSGASNVTIQAGAGNDTIWLTRRETLAADAANDKPAEYAYNDGVTINGGAGNDIIIAEYVLANGASSLNIGDPEKASLDPDVTAPRVFEFTNADGNDTIYFFGDNDVISLDNNTEYKSVSLSADEKDLIVNVGKFGSTKITATMTLKNYVDNEKSKTVAVSQVNASGGSTWTKEEKEIPKKLYGTTGSDSNIESTKDEYEVYALNGNDKVTNTANSVSIWGGAGNDTVYVRGSENYIFGEAGNEVIFLQAAVEGAADVTSIGADENVVDVGTGDDTIVATGEGHSNIYTFGTGEGTNYILNFSDGDIIRFKKADSDAYTADPAITKGVTSEGYTITIGTTKIILKGALKTEPSEELTDDQKAAYRANYSNYKNLDGDLIVNTQFWDHTETGATATTGAKFKDTDSDTAKAQWSVGYLIVGTNGHDSGTSAIKNDITETGFSTADGYTINAAAGNDLIYNTGVNVSISAGLGNDTVSLASDGVVNNTIYAGAGNDIIFGSTGGHVYEYNSSDGSDTILGFTDQDTIKINTAISGDDANERKAALANMTSVTNDGFLITFSSGNTILLKGDLKEIPTQDEFVATLTGEEATAYNALTEDKKAQAYAAYKAQYLGLESKIEAACLTNLGATAEPATTYANWTAAYEATTTTEEIAAGALTALGTTYNDWIAAYEASLNASDLESYNGLNEDKKAEAVTAYKTAQVAAYETAQVETYKSEKVEAYETAQVAAYKEEKIAEYNVTYLETYEADYPNKVANYNFLAVDTVIHVKDSANNLVTMMVPRQLNGTNSADTITVDEDYENYKINAMNGKDVINNSATGASINAGGDNDTINLIKGGDVTVLAGKGDDTINIAKDNQENHLFQFALGDGVNVINGLNEGDTIQITTADASVKSAAFDSAGYYVLTLSDSKTQIKLKGKANEEGEYQQLAGGYPYNLQLTETDKTDTTKTVLKEAEEKYIPKIYDFAKENVTAITVPDATSDINYSGYTFVGTDAANTIENSKASDVSINGGKGNDYLSNKGNKVTITAGDGKDRHSSRWTAAAVQCRYGGPSR